MSKIKKAIAANIAKYRKQAGLTQSQFAEYLSVTSQAVSKWECGLSVPDIDLFPEMHISRHTQYHLQLCSI